MNDQVRLHQCQLEEPILIGYNQGYCGVDAFHDSPGVFQLIETCVIMAGKSELDNALLGFKEDNGISKVRATVHPGWDIPSGIYVSPRSFSPQVRDKYRYGWWMSGMTLVMLSNQVLIPDQVCDACKNPAPHGKPNTHDGKYICASCKFLMEIQ